MRYSILVSFISAINFGTVCSFSDDLFSGEDFDASSSGLTEGPDLFDGTTENIAWTSQPSDSEGFDLDADLDDSDNISWDPDLTLADTTVSDSCDSLANPLSIAARDDSSCSPLSHEELLPSSQTIQLFEDPTDFLDNNFLPLKDQTDEQKPRYPGHLTPEQIKERARQEGEIWTLFHPPTNTDDPCGPYRSRGYIYLVCCEKPWDIGPGMDRWYIHLSLEGCETSTCFEKIKAKTDRGHISWHLLILNL